MKFNFSKLIEEILLLNKKAMPHVLLKNKGNADLFFEFLDSKEKINFFDDLTSDSSPEIDLPNFGHINDKIEISNPSAKTIKKEDLLRGSEDFIKLFVYDKRKPTHPFLEYDKQHHKYKLKQKYDIDKIFKDTTPKKK